MIGDGREQVGVKVSDDRPVGGGWIVIGDPDGELGKADGTVVLQRSIQQRRYLGR